MSNLQKAFSCDATRYLLTNTFSKKKSASNHFPFNNIVDNFDNNNIDF